MNIVSSILLIPAKFLFCLWNDEGKNNLPYVFIFNLGLFWVAVVLFLIHVCNFVDYEQKMQMSLKANPKPIASRKSISFLPRGALNSWCCNDADGVC